jgi:hypothetical protein
MGCIVLKLKSVAISMGIGHATSKCVNVSEHLEKVKPIML